MIAGCVRVIAASAFFTLMPACALLTKAAPVEPRYFSPEMAVAKHVEPASPIALELRLGRVNAGAYLKDRIVRRDSTYEVSYYDERLWTEKPETYVKRALAQAIFDERGVRQVRSGAALTLEVDVLAFEEVMKPAHVGRVELSYVLYDDRVVQLSRSVVVERPIAAAKGDAAADAIVEALASAMSSAVDAVAIAATSELHTEASAQTMSP
jgi:cholesterol transport system auxiliary component